jgi:hypothetical protein
VKDVLFAESEKLKKKRVGIMRSAAFYIGFLWRLHAGRDAWKNPLAQLSRTSLTGHPPRCCCQCHGAVPAPETSGLSFLAARRAAATWTERDRGQCWMLLIAIEDAASLDTSTRAEITAWKLGTRERTRFYIILELSRTLGTSKSGLR